MVIDVKQFEQYFSEAKLKKGLRLFEKELVELMRHPTENKYYFIANRYEIFLSVKKGKITNHTCSCTQQPFCEHLAAVLFYLYKDELQVAGSSININKADTSSTISNTKRIQKFTIELAKIRRIVDGFSSYNALSDKQIIDLLNKLKRSRDESEANLFYFDLAFCLEYYALTKFRFTGDEKPINDFFQQRIIFLQKNFEKGLSQQKISAWELATVLSLRSNNVLQSRFGFFLVPRYLQLTNSVLDLENIRQKLVKRKLKLHHSETIDPLKIAMLQVDFKLAELQAHTFKTGHELTGAELAIARAEMFFCANKTRKAFGLLERESARIKSNFKSQYLHFLDYIILQAKIRDQKKIEAQYLQDRLVYGLFISESDIQRLQKLLPANEKKEILDTLILRIGKSAELYAFNKLSFLLLREKRFDELIAEIKRQKKQFHLLHDLALKKIPEYSDELIKLYVKHLAEALSEAKYYEVQQLLFKESLNYITKLPLNDAFKLIRELLDKIGHQAQISKHIQQKTLEIYGDASLDL